MRNDKRTWLILQSIGSVLSLALMLAPASHAGAEQPCLVSLLSESSASENQEQVESTWEQRRREAYESHLNKAKEALKAGNLLKAQEEIMAAEKLYPGKEDLESLKMELKAAENRRKADEEILRQKEKEDASWKIVLGLGTEEAYEQYLSSYPYGRYAPEARRRLKALRDTPVVTEKPPSFLKEKGKTWTDSVTGMEFVWVPAGEFDMGSHAGSSDETPVRRVHVDGFWMGKYEVTQGQWQAVMGSNPSGFPKGDNYPVENVSWEDIQVYIQRLNLKTGQTFRLPTEGEWEYACRAGTTGERYGNLDEIAWHGENSGGSTHPVGRKKPNAFGLYDMLGNVWEWCQDWYGRYEEGEIRNPSGPPVGTGRVQRGGSWADIEQGVRAAVRANVLPTLNFDDFGFRLIRSK